MLGGPELLFAQPVVESLLELTLSRFSCKPMIIPIKTLCKEMSTNNSGHVDFIYALEYWSYPASQDKACPVLVFRKLSLSDDLTIYLLQSGNLLNELSYLEAALLGSYFITWLFPLAFQG